MLSFCYFVVSFSLSNIEKYTLQSYFFCEKCCYNYSSFVPVVHEAVTCQIVICFSKLVSNCHFNDCRMSLFIINFARYGTGLALREAWA